jgi:hypothetical protein
MSIFVILGALGLRLSYRGGSRGDRAAPSSPRQIPRQNTPGKDFFAGMVGGAVHGQVFDTSTTKASLSRAN